MDSQLNPQAPAPARSNKAIRFVIVLGLVLAAIVAMQSYRGYQQRQRDYRVETDNSAAVGKVIVSAFAKQNALKVRTLEGVVQTASATTGGIGEVLRADKVVKQPFSVDYFVNMGSLTLDDYSWDARAKTLSVRAPEVTPAKPNIDSSRATVSITRGVFVTRDMMDKLDRQIAVGARNQTAAEANKPENIAKAREAAAEAIAANLRGPLAAAGIGDVRVVVVPRGNSGPGRSDQRWDVSRSIGEVLRQQAARE
jgi:hypothetical protein